MHPVRTARSRCFTLCALGLLVTSCGSGDPLDLENAFQVNLGRILSTNQGSRRIGFAMYRENWPDVRPYVAELIESSDAAERMAGAYLVAELGTQEDLELLRVFLGDDLYKVRRIAMDGVVRLEDVGSIPLLMGFLEEAQYEEVKMTLRVLVSIDPWAGEEACDKRSRDDRWEHRRAAAEMLGMLNSEGSATLLEWLLEDEIWLVQKEAAEAVGRRRYEGGHSRLLDLCDHQRWEVRASAARALGQLGREDDLELVRGLAAEDEAKGVRVAAVEALAGFGPEPAMEIIREVLQKPEDQNVHLAALRCLIRMGAGKPAELLSEILEGEDEPLRDLAKAAMREESAAAAPGK